MLEFKEEKRFYFLMKLWAILQILAFALIYFTLTTKCVAQNRWYDALRLEAMQKLVLSKSQDN